MIRFRLGILLLLTTLLVKTSFSQQDSVTKAQIAQILKLLTDSNDKQKIGVLDYKLTAYLYYGEDHAFKSNKTITIDSISVLIKDGFIFDINVYAGDSKFTNKKAPIGLTGKRFTKEDFLENIFTEGESILLRELILPKFDNSFIPEDGFFWLTPSNKSVILERSIGINSVLDLRLYTDALGLLGNESNGLIQTDARFKQIIHRSNISNKGLFAPGQYIKINLTASKFDSKKKFVDISSFSRTELFQKSYVNAEAAVNLFGGWLPSKSLSSFYLDFGGAVNTGKVARKTDTINITTSNWFGEAGVNLKSSNNIGADLYIRLIKQSSPQTDFDNQGKIYTFWKLGAEVFWSSKSDRANKVFGRFNYVSSTNEVDRKNHFLQVQIGYSIILSKLKK